MSRPAVEIRPVAPGDVEFIATRMRAQDVAECNAAGHADLRAVLRQAVSMSVWARCAEVDGEPAALFGIAPLTISLMDPRGVPWLLGTDAVPANRRTLARLAPRYIREMLRLYPHLVNTVHTGNTVSVRWLKRMGFVLRDPHPHPVTGEPFQLFEMRNV